MFFFIYETKTIPLHFKNPAALIDYDKIVVSLDQTSSGVHIDFTDEQLNVDVENSLINLYLDQKTTSKFQVGSVKGQVNVYYQDRERDVSGTFKIKVLDNLYKKEMP